MKKANTNNGKQGGTLEGPSHDNGGIKVIITDDNRPVEVEGGEVIINKHAAKKHWKTLSKINQSAGNGVPIHEPQFKKGGNAVSDKVIDKRWDKKKNQLQELAKNIQILRNNVTRDLSSEDEKTALTALVISIMDSTAERVGNEDSADNGHFGVTGFQKRHVKLDGDKITFKYVGKSGVEQETTFTDKAIANGLRKAIANTPSKFVFRTSDGFQIKADKINRYLSDFNVTSKDIRGYSANKWIIEKLKQVEPEQEESKRKTQFNKIVSSVSEKIGHGKATLKKHYMLPSLETEFVTKGKVIDIKNGDLKYEGGGGFENGIDLFEDYENIPKKVQKILDRYSEDFEDGNYKGIQEALEDLEAIGYTFEYGLDGQAYDLRPIGKKGKTEMYAKGKNIKEKLAKNESEWYSFIREDLRKHNAESHEDDRMSLNDYIGEIGAIYGFKPVRDRRTFEWSLVRLSNNPLPAKNFSRMTESNLFNEYYKQAYVNDDYDEKNYNALMSEVKKRGLEDKFDQKALDKGFYKTGGELEKGVKVESEHIDTARKLYRRDITPEQAAESIAREHISEDPKYYSKLSKIEKNKRGATLNPKKFKGLEKALSEFEDLDILSYISDPMVSQTFLFFCKFKQKRKYGSNYGLFIYNEYTQQFIEEPASLDLYDITLDELNKKYPGLNVTKHRQKMYAQGATITPDMPYKIGETVQFNYYPRYDEKKVLVGVITDYLTNNKGYAISTGYSQIAVDEKDVIRLEPKKEEKKRFLFFEKGGVSDFDIADFYELKFAGGGAVEKAKQIITQKIGLSEEKVDYLISMNPKLAVWLADSIVTNEAKNYGLNSKVRADGIEYEIKTINDAKKLVVKKFNENPRYIRNNFATGIRSIIDWIAHPLTPKQNLRELSFQQALDKAHIFHEELKVLGGDIDYKEPKENTIIKEYPESDGVKYYWVYIPSNFCNIESSRMGHCGRTGYGNTLISLRSVKPYGQGHTISDSHVTIAYNPNEGLFYQTKGKKNQKPAEKYRTYIFDLIKMMANQELKLPIANENTGLVDEEPLEFNGFGSEYDSKEDYGFEDMTESEIKKLHSIRPEIFDNFEGKILLYDLGLSTEKPSTSFILYKPAKSVEDLLATYRNLRNDFVYSVISGDYLNEGDNWDYYYSDGGWEYGVDDLDKTNKNRIVEEIVRITNYSKEEVIKNGIKFYLYGEDENFSEDDFDNIKRSISNALASAERDAYHSYYYNQIKDALSELGVVKKLTDEGAEIGIDLSNFLTYAQIGQYMRDLNSEDLEDVFFESESLGELQLPELDIDDRYTASIDEDTFNEILAAGDLEEGYKRGGTTPTQRRKVAKVMHEWKAGRLHSGSKKGPIVKDQKQAVAIALSQAGLSKK